MKCLVKKCEKEGKLRGLCPRCYGAAYRAVKENKTSWEVLEETGLSKSGRNNSLFMKELEGRE